MLHLLLLLARLHYDRRRETGELIGPVHELSS